MLSVVVAADSAFVRRAITDWLRAEPDTEPAGAAENTDDALRLLAETGADTLVMELDLPGRSAFSVMAEAIEKHKVSVILLSDMQDIAEEVVLQARDAGAAGFLIKPDGGSHLSFLQMREQLLRKVRSAGFDRARASGGSSVGLKVAVLLASTGGTGEIAELVKRFPDGIPCSILIAQSLPAGKSYEYARRLDMMRGPKFKEAEDGDRLGAGLGFVAVAGRRTLVTAGKAIAVSGDPYSADELLKSVAATFGNRAVCVVLSGLGTDGVAGAQAIKQSGGHVIVGMPSEATIDSLPKAVLESGAAEAPTKYEMLAVALLEGLRGQLPKSA